MALAIVLAGPAFAGEKEDAEFLEFLEYLGSWEDSDEEWGQFLDEADAEAGEQFGRPFEPSEGSEDEDVVS